MKTLCCGLMFFISSQSIIGQIDTLLICDPKDVVELQAPLGRQGYKWTPPYSLDNPTIQNPIAYPVFNTLYVAEMIGEILGENLIKNPDFEEGNVGFESEYPYTDRIFTQGLYGVSQSAKELNGIFFTDCPDHTSGSGLMMVVDGSPIEGTKVWCQTIEIDSNTLYAFSTWLASVLGDNPAELQFTINDEQLGYSFSAVESVCQWRQFYQLWESNDTTLAEICIINKNTDPNGNDFALDDFLFVETEKPTFDSTLVIIEQVNVGAKVTLLPDCGQANGLITINPKGGAGRLSYAIDGLEFQEQQIFKDVSDGWHTLSIKDVTSAISEFNTCVFDTTILVSQNPCPVYIPNVIKRRSLNNGQFFITPHPDFKGTIASLSIYDRWGNLLYQSKDHATIIKGWNGKIQDQTEAPSGVYGYILEFYYPDGRVVQKVGDITLI